MTLFIVLTIFFSYKLRIESLLLKEEFNSQMVYFNKSFENLFNAAETIYSNPNLANMMLHICKIGNFINDVCVEELNMYTILVTA